jgi:hypothetical protein
MTRASAVHLSLAAPLGAAPQDRQPHPAAAQGKRKEAPVTTTTETAEATETAVSATGQDPLAVSGHAYPDGAVTVAAEAYWWHLGQLRLASSRAQAADRAQYLAQAAGKVAAALTGHPEATPDTHADPLAWTDISTLLGGLAIALGGVPIDSGSYPDALDGPYHGWEDLAGASTRREFAAAWYPFAQEFWQRVGLDGTAGQDDKSESDGELLLRAFAVAQVARAAAAIIDAAW